jgi:hypothetical protein
MTSGNLYTTELFLGSDNFYVKLANTGNVVINSNDGNSNTAMWTFDTTGNLILAGGNSVIQSIANSSLDPNNANVSTMVFTPDQNYTSQSLVIDPTGPSHIHLRAPGANIDEPDANIFLGGEDSSFEVGYYNGAAPNLFVHSGGNTWTFDTTGILAFPRDTDPNTADPILTIVGGANPSISAIDANLAGPANLGISALTTIFTGFNGDAIKIYPDDGEISSTANLQIWANSGGNTEYSWTFDTTGNLTLPGNLVINGLTNVFGSNVALLQSNNDVPLLSVSSSSNGGVSSLWVEDIGNVGTSNIAAVYANPTSGSKIVRIAVGQNGGNAGPNLWDFGTDGSLTLPIGVSIDYNGNVQYPKIIADSGKLFSVQGQGNSGSAALAWTVNPNAASQYAAVAVTRLGGDDLAKVVLTAQANSGDSANAKIWTFNEAGALTLPQGSQISETANTSVNITANANTWAFGVNGTLTVPGSLVTPNGANAVLGFTTGTAGAPLTLTAGTGGVAATGWNSGAGGDLTITAGDAGSNIGNQSWGEVGGDLTLRGGNATGPYIGGNVAIYSGAGPTAPGAISLNTGTNQWTFGADGTLTLPDIATIIAPWTDDLTLTAQVEYNICTIQNAGSGYTSGTPLPTTTTGGTGTGMTVNFGYGISGQLVSVSVSNPGTGYTNGDVIGVDGGTGTFVITKYNISANQANNNTLPTDWTFGTDGNLTLPTVGSLIGNLIVPGSIVGSGASPAPTLSGFSSVSALQFTNGNSNVTVNANSNLWTFDSTGNLIIPGSSGGFIKTVANASIGVAAVDNGTNNPAQLLSMTNAGAATSIVSAYATNATIQTNATGTLNTWAFDSAGNLTLPGNAVAIKFANGSAAFGNIATINLNGNTSQVLLGDGAFAAIPSSSIIANGNSNVSIATANGNVIINAVGNTTMTVTGTGANVTGTLTSTGKIGYASGSTVTQATNRGTGVTINAIAGTIITTSAAMVATEIDTFSVTNSSVDPNNDIVLAQIVSPNQGTYNCIANPAVIGGFNPGFFLNIVNISGFTTSDETITIRFMVIKAPNA